MNSFVVAELLITHLTTKESRKRELRLTEGYGATLLGELTSNGEASIVARAIAQLQHSDYVKVEILSTLLNDVDWKDESSIVAALTQKWIELGY